MTEQDLTIQDLRRENMQLRLKLDELHTKLEQYEERENGD